MGARENSAEGVLQKALPGLQRASAHCLAVEPPGDVRHRILIEALVQTAGDVADMRRRQYVRQAAERVVERQRLLVEDIDGCAGDLLVFKRSNEIGLRDN